MNPCDIFNAEKKERIRLMGQDPSLKKLGLDFIIKTHPSMYSYNYTWLSRPIIQYPQDIVAMQELIWETKPDLIIETGIAHGGSLILSASMLALLDYCEALESGKVLDPKAPHRRVLGLDIDIRAHNRAAIEAHPMANRIDMIQGSSISSEVIGQVREKAIKYNRILVCLDSNHTHEHALAELNAYASLVSVGSYCIVFDTIIEDLPKQLFTDRPWDKGNNPKTAVWEFLKQHDEFVIDREIEDKLLITVAPDGFLKRIK